MRVTKRGREISSNATNAAVENHGDGNPETGIGSHALVTWQGREGGGGIGVGGLKSSGPRLEFHRGPGKGNRQGRIYSFSHFSTWALQTDSQTDKA